LRLDVADPSGRVLLPIHLDTSPQRAIVILDHVVVEDCGLTNRARGHLPDNMSGLRRLSPELLSAKLQPGEHGANVSSYPGGLGLFNQCHLVAWSTQ
jgi:hypothetical protein